MVDLFKELEETKVFLKEYKDIRIALDICTEYMDDQRNIVNNALDRIKAKEVLLKLELKNYEESMAKTVNISDINKEIAEEMKHE